MDEFLFPTSQGELIKTARGKQSQAEFAKLAKVDRSCLSRYENEQLGAPTALLNYCLRAVAALVANDSVAITPVARALRHARQAVSELEQAEAGPRAGASSAALRRERTRR